MSNESRGKKKCYGGCPDISIQKRSKLFGIRVIKAYSELSERGLDDADKILTAQFFRSGTSRGTHLSEGEFAQSRADLTNKYSIALKEASETRYWLEITIGAESAKPEKLSLMLDEVIGSFGS